MPAQDPHAAEERKLADSREVLRQVREAGREAVREARRAARESNREAREHIMATVREARETLRSAAREARHSSAEAGTRSRIQRIALQLFSEHGYEATSLREIAEHLGVTKAALYYHFKTKDEIINSLVDDRLSRVGELIEWAGAQPRTVETRRELLRRYSDLLYQSDHQALIKFFERNQSSMAQHPAGAQMRDQMLRLLQQLVEPDTPLTDYIRRSLSIFVLHSVWFTVRDPSIGEDERSEAALSVALELVE